MLKHSKSAEDITSIALSARIASGSGDSKSLNADLVKGVILQI